MIAEVLLVEVESPEYQVSWATDEIRCSQVPATRQFLTGCLEGFLNRESSDWRYDLVVRANKV